MKQTGMLVVSLRGVNFGFWSLLRVFRAKRQYFKPLRSRLGFREELEIYDNAFKNYFAIKAFDDYVFISLKGLCHTTRMREPMKTNLKKSAQLFQVVSEILEGCFYLSKSQPSFDS